MLRLGRVRRPRRTLGHRTPGHDRARDRQQRQQDRRGQAPPGQADEERSQHDQDREPDRAGDPLGARQPSDQHHRPADDDRRRGRSGAALTRIPSIRPLYAIGARVPTRRRLVRERVRVHRVAVELAGSRSGRSPHAAGSSGSFDPEDADRAVAQDLLGAGVLTGPERLLGVGEAAGQIRVVHRHHVVVLALVDLLAPGLAIGDPQVGAVLALDPEPLDMVREVGSRRTRTG